jgi:hypothetical protein
MSGEQQDAVFGLTDADCRWVLTWLAIGADYGMSGQTITDGAAALRTWKDRHPELADQPVFLQRPGAAGGSGG